MNYNCDVAKHFLKQRKNGRDTNKVGKVTFKLPQQTSNSQKASFSVFQSCSETLARLICNTGKQRNRDLCGFY